MGKKSHGIMYVGQRNRALLNGLSDHLRRKLVDTVRVVLEDELKRQGLDPDEVIHAYGAVAMSEDDAEPEVTPSEDSVPTSSSSTHSREPAGGAERSPAPSAGSEGSDV